MQKRYLPFIKLELVSTQAPDSWETRMATWSLTAAANCAIIISLAYLVDALIS